MEPNLFVRYSRLLAAASIVLPASSNAEITVEPEILVGFRGPAPYPDGGGSFIWFPTTRTETDLQDGLDVGQIANFGWSGIESFYLADLNGDGVDDKIMFQIPGPAQVIATYTGTVPTTFTTNDFNDPNGDLDTPYAWIPHVVGNNLVFGDLDNDGIDDTCYVIPGDALDNDAAPVISGGDATALYWGNWASDGNIGISNPASGPFSGWNPFGVVGLDHPMLGDFNGDGVHDRLLFRADPAGNGSQPPQLFVDYSNPAGGWGDGGADFQLTIGINGDKLQIGDVNGDGLDDLVLYARPNPSDSNLQDIFAFFNDGADFATFNGASPDLQDVWGIGDGVLFGQLTLPVSGDPGGARFAITKFNLNSDGSLDLTIDTTAFGVYEIWGATDLDLNSGEFLGDQTGGPGFLDFTIDDATLDSVFGDVRPRLFVRAEEF